MKYILIFLAIHLFNQPSDNIKYVVKSSDPGFTIAFTNSFGEEQMLEVDSSYWEHSLYIESGKRVALSAFSENNSKMNLFVYFNEEVLTSVIEVNRHGFIQPVKCSAYVPR